jgi:UDP-glucose 4-epimerase
MGGDVVRGERFVVTGGAGFIGSYLVELLLRRGADRVTVVDGAPRERWGRLNGVMHDPRFAGVQSDVRDEAALADVLRGHDVLVHMAAGTDMRRGASDPSWDFEHGILATRAVLEAARRAGVRRLLFVSSSAVYGELACHHPVREDEGPLLPISMYGAGKLAGEGLMSAYAGLFGLEVRIVRLGTVLGRRMDHGVVHAFVQQVANGADRLRILGDGRQARTFILAEDCVAGMLHVLGQPGGPAVVFNLSGDGVTTVVEVARLVLDEAGRPDLPIELAGGDRGWTGDVPVVSLSLERLHRSGWRAPSASSEAVRVCARQLLGRDEPAPLDASTGGAAPAEVPTGPR